MIWPFSDRGSAVNSKNSPNSGFKGSFVRKELYDISYLIWFSSLIFKIIGIIKFGFNFDCDFYYYELLILNSWK